MLASSSGKKNNKQNNKHCSMFLVQHTSSPLHGLHQFPCGHIVTKNETRLIVNEVSGCEYNPRPVHKEEPNKLATSPDSFLFAGKCSSSGDLRVMS